MICIQRRTIKIGEKSKRDNFQKQKVRKMSLRHVVRIEGMPDLAEETFITIRIPPNAGSSFPVEVAFPSDLLSNPAQLSAAPITQVGAVSPASGSPSVLPSPVSRFPSATDSFSFLPPETSGSVQEVSMKSPVSPGREILSQRTLSQQFLPSVRSGITAPPSSVPVSRASLSTFPTTVSGQTATPSRRQVSPGSFQAASAGSPLSGPILASRFLSDPATISTSNPVTVPETQAYVPSPAPVSPTLAESTPSRDLATVLTSPKIMSPKSYQSGSRPRTVASAVSSSRMSSSEPSSMQGVPLVMKNPTVEPLKYDSSRRSGKQIKTPSCSLGGHAHAVVELKARRVSPQELLQSCTIK